MNMMTNGHESLLGAENQLPAKSGNKSWKQKVRNSQFEQQFGHQPIVKRNKCDGDKNPMSFVMDVKMRAANGTMMILDWRQKDGDKLMRAFLLFLLLRVCLVAPSIQLVSFIKSSWGWRKEVLPRLVIGVVTPTLFRAAQKSGIKWWRGLGKRKFCSCPQFAFFFR